MAVDSPLLVPVRSTGATTTGAPEGTPSRPGGTEYSSYAGSDGWSPRAASCRSESPVGTCSYAGSKQSGKGFTSQIEESFPLLSLVIILSEPWQVNGLKVPVKLPNWGLTTAPRCGRVSAIENERLRTGRVPAEAMSREPARGGSPVQAPAGNGPGSRASNART
jgi:hypothetical protein